VLDSAGGNGIRIFRFNIVRDWINEGIMELSGSPTTWKVYANLFYKSYSGPWRMGSVVDSQYREHTLYFYNNDVVNTWAVVLRAGNNGSWSSDSRALNNIFWNMRDSDNNYLYGCPGLNSSDDYNFCDYSGITGPHSIGNGNNPFVDYPSNDFRIVPTIGATYPREKGIALSPEFAIDAVGNMRGSDGTWDIGAYEYMEGKDTTPPAAPSGLSVR
jgi:hypothetical protein